MSVVVEHTYTHVWTCDACKARVLSAYAYAAQSDADLQRRIPTGWVVRTVQTNRGTTVKHICEKCEAA